VILGSSGRVRQTLGRLVIIGAIAVNIAGVARIEPALNLPWEEGVSLEGSHGDLIQFLEARKLDRFYADYWTVYPVMFETREKLLGFVIRDGIDVGWNRYIPAAHEVGMSERPAIVQITGTEGAVRFKRLLADRSINHRQEQVGVYTVYWDFSERVFGF